MGKIFFIIKNYFMAVKKIFPSSDQGLKGRRVVFGSGQAGLGRVLQLRG
ncbi:hypothetical protein [Pusillimonas sp.]|nr:hypothetical protein [Pusillimonas sp.]MDX3896369.1 hypothetical protein [Pusillimonas sp.]